jgi:DNA-binding MarR family transcriptional regulator
VATSIERTRTEAVQGLFDGLLHFSRTLRSRSGDWGHGVQDLTRGEIVCLGVVERRGPTRPGQIAVALGVDASVVSRQLAALDRLGLVARGTDPLDGRAELISITPPGGDRLRQSRTAMCDALGARLAGWEPEDISRAAAVIENLADLLHDTPETAHTADFEETHA